MRPPCCVRALTDTYIYIAILVMILSIIVTDIHYYIAMIVTIFSVIVSSSMSLCWSMLKLGPGRVIRPETGLDIPLFGSNSSPNGAHNPRVVLRALVMDPFDSGGVSSMGPDFVYGI